MTESNPYHPMKSKTLVIETTKGTRHYVLEPDSRHGYTISRVTHGFFGSSTKHVGHGSSVENAVMVARLDAGDSTIKSTRLRD